MAGEGGTKIGSVFYEIEGRTAHLEQQIARAKASLSAVENARPTTVRVEGDTTGVDRATRKAKDTLNDVPGVRQSLVSTLTADISKFEAELARAKKTAATLVGTGASPAVVAKVDASIAGFEAKIKTARAQAEQLATKPITARVEAQVAGLSAGLKKATTDITAFVEKYKNPVPVPIETGKIEAFVESFRSADTSIAGLSRSLAGSLAAPAAAVGILAAAFVTLVGVAARAAAEVDQEMRQLRASLPDTTTDVAGLTDAIEDLSTVTPRAQTELTKTAAALARMGTADPAEIARSLNTLALAGDALGKTELTPLADALDLIQDAFGLTAEGARQAFVQIVAMTKGRIQIEDLAGVLGRSATRMNALGISAQDAAAAMTTLIDAGVNSRQITTGLVDLLEKSGSAQRAAREAALANRDGDAKALRIFASSVNASTIESRGLVGALGDLYRAFNGNFALFEQAGLSLNDYQIAQKAAEASTRDAKTEVKNYNTSLQEVAASAQVNRESAAALVGVLKNELSAELINLGEKVLPPVLKGLLALADLFGGVRGEAREAANAARTAAKEFTAAASERTRLGRATMGGDALRGTVRNAQQIITSPRVLTSEYFDVATLTAARDNFLKALSASGGRALGTGAMYKEVIEALVLVERRLREVTPAAESASAATGTTTTTFENLGTKGAQAIEKFKDLAQSIRDYANAAQNAENPIGALAAKQGALEEQLIDTFNALPKAAQTANTRTFVELLDALSEGGKRLKAAQVAETMQRTTDLIAKVSGSSVAALRAEYERLTKSVVDQAKAEEQAGRPERAAELRALLPMIREQGESLARTQQVTEEYARASKLASDGTLAFNRGVGTGLTDIATRAAGVAQLGAANALLATAEAKAREEIARTLPGTKERNAAEAQLNDILKQRAGITSTVTPAVTSVRTMADDTVTLGNEMGRAAQNALTLVSLLGKGNGPLASLIAGVGTLADGVTKVGEAAKAAQEAKTKGQSIGAAATLGPYVAVAAGVIAIAGAFDLFGKKAKAEAEAMRRAAADFEASLAVFRRSITEAGTSVAGQRRNELAGTIGKQVQDAAKVVGLSVPDGLRQTSEGLRVYTAQLREQGRAAVEAGQYDYGTRLFAFADQLERVAIGAKLAEDALREEQAAKLKERTESLEIRRLAGAGRSIEADAARRQAEYAREIAEAESELEGADGLLEYLRALRDVQAQEEANIVATQQRTAALKAFDERARLTGLTGVDYLAGLVETYATSFGELGGILDGLVVDGAISADGLATLRERAASIFDALAVDGITDAEQAIIDALMAIVTNAEGIADQVETVAQRFAKALDAVSLDNDILGGSEAEQFERLRGVASGLNEQIGAILADLDLSDAASAETARQRLRDLYVSMAADGLDESEQAIVNLIRQLLGGIDDVINEETENTESARQRVRTAARDRARENIEIGDLTGSDAFREVVASYGDRFRELLGNFDTDTIGGVDGASEALRALLAGIREGTVDLDAFAGMTQDEIIAAILDLDGALDELGRSAEEVARETLRAAEAQREFIDSTDVDFLRASGRDREADTKLLEADIAEKIRKAKELGVSDDVINQIIKTGDLKLRALNERYDAEAVREAERVASETAGAATTASNRRSEFIASAVTQITGAQALQITDYLASSLIEQRGTRIAAEALLALAGGERLPVLAPALPPGVGGPTGLVAGGGLTLIVNFNGPLSGREAAEDFIEAAVPVLDAYLARAASTAATNRGRTLT